MFGKLSRTTRYEISKAFFGSRIAQGSSVNNNVLKMIGYIKHLADLGFLMDNDLSIDLILQSLPHTFSNFIMNFNMNKIECTLAELLNMLKTTEAQILSHKS